MSAGDHLSAIRREERARGDVILPASGRAERNEPSRKREAKYAAHRKYYEENRERILAMGDDAAAERVRERRRLEAQRRRDQDQFQRVTKGGPCVCGHLRLEHRRLERRTAVGTVLVYFGALRTDPTKCPKYEESDAGPLPRQGREY